MLSSVSCFGEIAKETSAALTLLGRRNAHDTLTTGYTLRKKKGGKKLFNGTGSSWFYFIASKVSD